MIQLTKEKIIILVPPKCGSSTLEYLFTEVADSTGISIRGPQLGRPDIEKHTHILPYLVQDSLNPLGLTHNPNDQWLIAMAVRNPYTRALSIYNHYLKFDRPKKIVNCFADFVKYYLVPGGHYFSHSLFSFCKQISFPIPFRVANDNDDNLVWPKYFIHLETLKEDIERLGFVFPEIPCRNPSAKGENYATMEDYTPETIDLVKAWGEMDFNSFGYYHDFGKYHLVKEKTKLEVPSPPEEFMGAYKDTPINLYLGGKKTFEEMRSNIRKVCNFDIREQEKVLDFGCRVGRVTKAFDPDKEIWGTDIRKDIIDWCKDNLNHNYNFVSNEPDVFKLPFEDNYFNFIYSLSVFAHIEHLKEWLCEIIRILNKDKIFYLSINDELATYKMMKISERGGIPWFKNIRKILNLDEFLLGDRPVVWDGYFSFIKRDYFLSLLPNNMEILGVNNSESFQTAYILKKINDNPTH